MTGNTEPENIEPTSWQANYFNYFTEIEEHFQKARGTSLFLLSPLDWALIESWKDSGVPLEAVLRGIDEAFEKWRSRKSKMRMVNSLAYCAQAVMEAAQQMAGAGTLRPSVQSSSAPFELEELKQFLSKTADLVRRKEHPILLEIASHLDKLIADAETHYANLEDLEHRLTTLEEKMIATARTLQSDEDLLTIRRELESSLKPYRGKMTTEQLAMLERQYLDRQLLERAGLPRLSLFYLH